MSREGGERPVFVPVAFSEEEALHLLGAARAVIQSATSAGESKAIAPLVHAQVRLAEATDKARAERGRFAMPGEREELAARLRRAREVTG